MPPFWGAGADSGVRYFFVEIADANYHRTRLATIYALPLAALAFLGLALYVRALYLKNREYRIRIAVQKNLVVLGTAASTLAHEIKNPLLSIRLQTGILRKLHESDPPEELAVIDEEINRLSSLTFKINDYLRDAAGRSGPLDVGALVAETSLRLCGVNILTNRDAIPACRDAAILVEMDEDRARSVIENILTNALESGSPTSLIQAIITRTGGSSFAPGRGTGMVRIDIADRGCGLCGTDPGILFDPFYTSKSRGTGIGLAVCKRFVEAAGGAIAAASREGGGVIVSVTLKEYADTDR
jgi:two-component system sensor histidine kinase HydH